QLANGSSLPLKLKRGGSSGGMMSNDEYQLFIDNYNVLVYKDYNQIVDGMASDFTLKIKPNGLLTLKNCKQSIVTTEQDITDIKYDIDTINLELSRQTHFRGYQLLNSDITNLPNSANGDFSVSAESGTEPKEKFDETIRGRGIGVEHLNTATEIDQKKGDKYHQLQTENESLKREKESMTRQMQDKLNVLESILQDEKEEHLKNKTKLRQTEESLKDEREKRIRQGNQIMILEDEMNNVKEKLEQTTKDKENEEIRRREAVEKQQLDNEEKEKAIQSLLSVEKNLKEVELKNVELEEKMNSSKEEGRFEMETKLIETNEKLNRIENILKRVQREKEQIEEQAKLDRNNFEVKLQEQQEKSIESMQNMEEQNTQIQTELGISRAKCISIEKQFESEKKTRRATKKKA
ncbi:MAG: hypothetical protein EZS28_031617, partial [Streblomastix strix]